MKRFEDYKKEVILAYEEKKKENTLPYNLENLSYVNLRNECLEVFESRYTEKDNSTFKNLFQKDGTKEKYYDMLEGTTPPFFRPLYDFLRGKSNNTNKRYIELLAFLIDFEPRPNRPYTYEIRKSSPSDEKPKGEPEPDAEKPEADTIPEHLTEQKKTAPENPISRSNPITERDQITDLIPVPTPELENPVPEKEPEPIPDQENPAPDEPKSTDPTAPIDPENERGIFGIPRKYYRTIAICLFAFVAISGAIIIWNTILKSECMYWDGDRYQYTDCDKNLGYGTIILDMDPHKYAHLKRITKPSQIRISDVGKVHYSKMNNEVLFYTTGGENPVDTARRLLPMTPYIYWKYAAGKKQ
ncbi:hypothetical protein [Pedobacter gandavensis]|uniref:hypothetical protein n=1 Tax=Pedobacter gandavensis TaxID=2679963 RepID=UPI00292DB391|nr:hypothetical protein [Pedobacter gandavensis]